MADKSSLSQKQFAARVGLSRQYIGRLVASGKLPVLEDKSIPMPEGLAALHALRGQVPAAASVPGAARPATPTAPSSPAPARAPDPLEAAAQAATARINLDIRKAQLSERAVRAKLLDLELRAKSGSLVEVAVVEADARSCAETLREQLLALPPRVASQIESLAANPAGPPRAAAIEAVIAAEVNGLISFVQSRFLE